MQDFTRSMPMMLYRALHGVMPRFRAIFSEFGLTETQWRVLRVLWEHQQIAFGDLARLTLIPAPSLVGVIDRLHANGLVDRLRSDTDRRHVYVVATRAGRALEKQVMPAVESAYADLEAMLGSNTRKQLLAGLDLLAALDRDNASDAGIDG